MLEFAASPNPLRIFRAPLIESKESLSVKSLDLHEATRKEFYCRSANDKSLNVLTYGK